ncbi:MAG TPA: hypothetical protein VGB77_01300 [Abditibacteriaceae bacterium]|jgi:hypothetical protein
MNAKEKVWLWIWAVSTVSACTALSFICYLFMLLDYSERHTVSTAGDYEPTEQSIIVGEITESLIGTTICLTIIALVLLQLNDEIFTSMEKQGRRIWKFSYFGLALSGINLLILFSGPLLANITYYLERAPLFPK